MKNLNILVLSIIAFFLLSSKANCQFNGEIPLNQYDKISYSGIINTTGDKTEISNKVKGSLYKIFNSMDKNINMDFSMGEKYIISFQDSYFVRRGAKSERLVYKTNILISEGLIEYEITEFVLWGIERTWAYTNTYGYTTLSKSGNYHYNLEKFNTEKNKARKNNMFITIDNNTNWLIQSIKKELLSKERSEINNKSDISKEITEEFNGPQGKIKCIGQAINDKKVGEWICYYETGEILSKQEMNEDKPDGEFTSFFKNGIIEEKGQYKGGALDGTWLIFNIDKSIKGTAIWDEGKKVNCIGDCGWE